MTDGYENVGYGAQSIGFGEKPGIVVVDFQRAFTDPRFQLGNCPMIHDAVDNTSTLLKTARAANIPVAVCYTAYTSERDAPHWKVPIVLEEFRHGHPCTELDPRIYEPGYDAVYVKTGPSIFFQTGAVEYFVKERVDTLIVTGCTTSGCIRATVIDAFSYGYRVAVPETCVGDVEEGPHRDNLRDVGRRYADIVTLEQALDYVEKFRKRNAP